MRKLIYIVTAPDGKVWEANTLELAKKIGDYTATYVPIKDKPKNEYPTMTLKKKLIKTDYTLYAKK